ncbi:MAG TPA: hypothetical protein VFN97_06160 [Actinospica sp.]|nr:hypothetical protein [Actinospica sp.]
MQIRELNPTENPRDLATVTAAHARWVADYLPALPDAGEVRIRHWCTSGYEQASQVYGVFADEHASEAQGVAVYGYELTKNLNLAYCDLEVSAAGRESGAEAALFEHLMRRTAELGRSRLATGIPQTMEPLPFAEKHGGKVTDTAIMSTLDLTAIDRAQYEAWAEPTAKNSEYTLVGWVGRCPEELVESYCAAMDAMADQPIGTFEYTWAKYSVDRLRFGEEMRERLGVRLYVQAALDPAGNIAGFNILGCYPDEPERIEIWDTGVVRGHRGHGLGLRVKAAASLWVLEDRPSTRVVRTYNNDENEWMLAVNRALGYRPLVRFPGYEFAIAD